MKKRTILILSLISILVMVAGTAMTHNGGRSLGYPTVSLSGKQVVFTFNYTGDFSNAELKNAYAFGIGGDGDGNVNVHCVKNADKQQIRCIVGKAIRYNAVTLVLAGIPYQADVPAYTAPAAAGCLGLGFIDGNGQAISWENVTENYGGYGSAEAFFEANSEMGPFQCYDGPFGNIEP